MNDDNYNIRILQGTIDKQCNTISQLELKISHLHELIKNMKQKHFDINYQLIQANVSYQQSISESDKIIKKLYAEKEELLIQLSNKSGEEATLLGKTLTLEVENKILLEQNQKLLDLLGTSLSNTTQINQNDDVFIKPNLPESKNIIKQDKNLFDNNNSCSTIEDNINTNNTIKKNQETISTRTKRRTRSNKTKNYTEPSLRSKMRRDK